jgi:UDP-galactose transporter B1
MSIYSTNLDRPLISIALGSAAFLSGGVQNRLKKKSAQLGIEPKPYDFMFWTNLYMAITAAVLSVALGEGRPSLHIHTCTYMHTMKSIIITFHTYNAGSSGLQFCLNNPLVLQKILYFSICSAIGQSFIFFSIANFDPLVCTTVGAYIHTTHTHTYIHICT